MFNDDGTVAGYRETHRNNWQIENIALERNRERLVHERETGQPEESDVKSSYPENMSKVTISGLLLNTGLQRIQKNIKTKNTAREELERPDFNLISAQVNKAATLLTC